MTLVFQLLRLSAHMAATVQLLPLRLTFVNEQEVSPAQAPPGLMTAGKNPLRLACGEQAIACGAHTPA